MPLMSFTTIPESEEDLRVDGDVLSKVIVRWTDGTIVFDCLLMLLELCPLRQVLVVLLCHVRQLRKK
jgi:hypothetical protein